MGTYFILKIPRNTFYRKNETCQIECESLGSQSRFSIFKIIWFKERCLKWIEKLTPWEIFLSWIGTDLLLTLRAGNLIFYCFSWTNQVHDSIMFRFYCFISLWLQTLLGDHLADCVGGDDIHSFQSKWKRYQLLLKCRS